MKQTEIKALDLEHSSAFPLINSFISLKDPDPYCRKIFCLQSSRPDYIKLHKIR